MKRAKTSTFLIELPLHVDWNQERHLRAHLEAARCLYNALLSEANSVEGKRNDVGLRFVLDLNAGAGGFLLWNKVVIPAIIDWLDPVVQHGLRHTIKYVRLIRRKASSQKAQGADHEGNRYFVQLVLEGHAFTESKRYQATRRQHATAERKLAAHRKSLHGKLAHDIVGAGNRVQIEKTSFTGWQKPRSQRWHWCPYGLGPVQRDLYSAFLLAHPAYP
jgi:hypothetical protein